MYLTKDEFIILSGLKQGYSLWEIGGMYNIPVGTNDPRIISLCKKYGINEKYDIKTLVKKADLNKVVVTDKRDDIPYFKYEGYELVDAIRICKQDVKELAIFFNTFIKEEDKYKYYEIHTYDDGLYQYIKLLDKENNKKYTIRTVIDGEEENGSEKNWQ